VTPLIRSLVLLLALALAPARLFAWESELPEDPGLQAGEIPAAIQPAELPPPEETRGMLVEILAQPEFTTDGQQDTGESILQKLNDWLNRLFGRSAIGGLGWPGVGLVIALLCLVIYLLVRLWLGFSRSRAVRSTDTESEQLPATADALLALSREAADAGDYRRAVRLLFNAALKGLNMPSSSLQTNYQVLAFARRNHMAAESSLRKLIAIFEDAWYGSLPCGHEEYGESEQLYRDFSASIYRGES
jgi:hypothetical protein